MLEAQFARRHIGGNRKIGFRLRCGSGDRARYRRSSRRRGVLRCVSDDRRLRCGLRLRPLLRANDFCGGGKNKNQSGAKKKRGRRQFCFSIHSVFHSAKNCFCNRSVMSERGFYGNRIYRQRGRKLFLRFAKTNSAPRWFFRKQPIGTRRLDCARCVWRCKERSRPTRRVQSGRARRVEILRRRC